MIDSGNSDSATAFPNLAKVAAIVIVLPVTTATVERSFSAMKLHSRLGEDPLEQTMRICIKSPDQLSDDIPESVVDHYKRVKKSKLAFKICNSIQFQFNFLEKENLDPQVDQGDFPKINWNDLITSICFHTRLDTLSVNSPIYNVSYYLQVYSYLEFCSCYDHWKEMKKCRCWFFLMVFTY